MAERISDLPRQPIRWMQSVNVCDEWRAWMLNKRVWWNSASHSCVWLFGGQSTCCCRHRSYLLNAMPDRYLFIPNSAVVAICNGRERNYWAKLPRLKKIQWGNGGDLKWPASTRVGISEFPYLSFFNGAENNNNKICWAEQCLSLCFYGALARETSRYKQVQFIWIWRKKCLLLCYCFFFLLRERSIIPSCATWL